MIDEEVYVAREGVEFCDVASDDHAVGICPRAITDAVASVLVGRTEIGAPGAVTSANIGGERFAERVGSREATEIAATIARRRDEEAQCTATGVAGAGRAGRTRSGGTRSAAGAARARARAAAARVRAYA